MVTVTHGELAFEHTPLLPGEIRRCTKLPLVGTVVGVAGVGVGLIFCIFLLDDPPPPHAAINKHIATTDTNLEFNLYLPTKLLTIHITLYNMARL
jgi:hypothetical protein